MSPALVLAAALAVRNPFWPIDYDGPLEAITDEPKVVVETTPANEGDDTATAASAAAENARRSHGAEETLPRHWQKAARELRNTTRTTITLPDGGKRLGFIINGRTYGVGDLVSLTHEGRRFTWRVLGRTESGGPKLKRVKAHIIKTDPQDED